MLAGIYLAKTYYLCSKSGNSKQWCNKQLPDAVIRASSTHKSTVQAFRDMSSKDIFQQNMPTGFNIFSKHIYKQEFDFKNSKKKMAEYKQPSSKI